MEKKAISILLLGLFMPYVLHGQPRNVRFKHLTLQDGISQNNIFALMQDRKGFLWIGTGDGLNRYDGYTITQYKHDPENPNSLSGNNIMQIGDDESGKIWVVSTGGFVDKLDPRTGKVVRYRHDPDAPDSLQFSQAGSVTSRNGPYQIPYADREGMLWFGTRDGLLNRLDPENGTITRYLHEGREGTRNDPVNSALQDHLGYLWFGTVGRGLYRYDPETDAFTRFLHDPADPSSLSHPQIRSPLYEDPAGHLWIVTERGLNLLDRDTDTFIRFVHDPDDPATIGSNRVRRILGDHRGYLWLNAGPGVDRLDPKTGKVTRYRHDPNDAYSIASGAASSLYVDRSGALWVGMARGGLARYDPKRDGFIRYQYDPGNPGSINDDQIMAILEDHSGVLWIATYTGGLSMLDPYDSWYTSYYPRPAPAAYPENEVLSVYKDRSGTLWAGTYAGLSRIDRQTGAITHYIHDAIDPTSISSGAVVSIYEDRRGRLWIGLFGGGLNRFDPEKEEFFRYRHGYGDLESPDKLAGSSVYTIHEDWEGKLWLASHGLSRLDPETDTFTHYLSDPQNPNALNRDFTTAIYEDSAGFLWIGTVGGGLNKFDREKGTFSLHLRDRPPYLRIQTIHERPGEPGILWIGTFGFGLYRYDTTSDQYTLYTEQNSDLPSNTILGITEESTGKLWLSTNNGLSRFDLEAETYTNYTVDIGLQSNGIAVAPFSRSDDGELLFGGTEGFIAFYPEDIISNPYPPQIEITGYRTYNQRGDSLAVPSGTRPILSALDLPYAENDIALDYVGLHFSRPEQEQYAYMLEGYDDAWRDVGTQRTATYTNLAAGRYTFRVKAANSDGVWNEAGASVGLRVLPPWWQTWGFRFLAAALVVGLLTAAYRYRVAQLLKTERLRLRIASDLHDDVGSTLSAIAMRSELLRDRALHDHVEDLELHRISQAAEGTIDTLREIIWFIDPKHDRLDDLVDKMRGAAADLLNGTAYTFEAPDWQERRALSMDFRRQVFLIYKEALHNVVRHAEAEQVAIRVESRDGWFTLQVEDNGLGFVEVTDAYRGHGLRNMRRRAEQLGGTLSLESVPGIGTTVELSARMA